MVWRDNGDNGPPPNGFWLTKGKDDDRDDDDGDNVDDDDDGDDGDNSEDDKQWDTADNGGAAKANGFGQQ